MLFFYFFFYMSGILFLVYGYMVMQTGFNYLYVSVEFIYFFIIYIEK